MAAWITGGLNSEQLTEELIGGQGLLADLVEIGLLEVAEVACDDELDVPGDGRCEDVAIFFVVWHLVSLRQLQADRASRRKGRQHCCSQTLPLIRLKDTVRSGSYESRR